MQATRESRVVCVCVCVLLQDGLFSCQTVNSLPLPDSSVSTDYNQRLFSFHFFHSGLLCVLRVVGKQEDLYIKESLLWRGEKMMFPTSFSCSNQLNSTPSPRFQCNNNCVLSLHLLAAFFLLGDFLYAPHFHFIIIIIFIWVCLKSCFLSVNLWDKWIGILVGLFKIRGCLFVDFSFAFSKLHIVLVDH